VRTLAPSSQTAQRDSNTSRTKAQEHKEVMQEGFSRQVRKKRKGVRNGFWRRHRETDRCLTVWDGIRRFRGSRKNISEKSWNLADSPVMFFLFRHLLSLARFPDERPNLSRAAPKVEVGV